MKLEVDKSPEDGGLRYTLALNAVDLGSISPRLMKRVREVEDGSIWRALLGLAAIARECEERHAQHRHPV